MFRKKTFLRSLALRKQLLLSESEINRAELVKEIDSLKGEVARVKKQVRTFGSIASSAAVLATAVSVFRRGFGSSGANHNHNHSQDAPPKTSWVSAALDGARMGTSLYLKIKSLLR